MTSTPSRLVLSFACALLLLACGGTKGLDGGSDGASDQAGASGGASGGSGSGTGGSGGVPGGTGGRGTGGSASGSGGAGGDPGVFCTQLAACCATISNLELRSACLAQYRMVMAMGDAACGTALTQIRAAGATCP